MGISTKCCILTLRSPSSRSMQDACDEGANVSDEILRVLSEPTVDVPTTARVLGVTPRAIYAAIARGDLPATRLGKVYRVPTIPLRQILALPGRSQQTA